MEEAEAYYIKTERVRIMEEQEYGYLIEYVESGRIYAIDKEYFHSKFRSEADQLPVHQELWDKMHQQALELHQLKCANTNMRKELRGERKKFESLRKKTEPKQHIRKGQKRGSYGRNG